MKLLLTVCLICALLNTANSLHCHMCTDQLCANSTSVMCPATSTVCKTVTSVLRSGSSTSVRVSKNCSSLLSCITPLNVETEWSVNRGFTKGAYTQICCVTDNCNFQILATPTTLMNGKQCPACASSADSLAGNCSATVSCEGVENSCFNGTTTSDPAEVLQLGCISTNLCGIPLVLEALLGADAKITCGAPWSIRLSAVLLTFALTVHKALV